MNTDNNTKSSIDNFVEEQLTKLNEYINLGKYKLSINTTYTMSNNEKILIANIIDEQLSKLISFNNIIKLAIMLLLLLFIAICYIVYLHDKSYLNPLYNTCI